MTTPDPVPAIEARHEEYAWSGSHADVAYVSGIHRDRDTLLALVRELRAVLQECVAPLEDLAADRDCCMTSCLHCQSGFDLVDKVKAALGYLP